MDDTEIVLCRCRHLGYQHDSHGTCELCGCDDFRSDVTELAEAVGVLVPAPRIAPERGL